MNFNLKCRIKIIENAELNLYLQKENSLFLSKITISLIVYLTYNAIQKVSLLINQ